jgi:hypothetical protein
VQHRLGKQAAERGQRHRPPRRPAGPGHRRAEVDKVGNGVGGMTGQVKRSRVEDVADPGEAGQGRIVRMAAVQAHGGLRVVKDAGGGPGVSVGDHRRHEIVQRDRTRRLAQRVQHRQALPAGVVGEPEWHPRAVQPGECYPLRLVRTEFHGPTDRPREAGYARCRPRAIRRQPDQVRGDRHVPRLTELGHILRAAQLPERQRDAKRPARLDRDRRAKHPGAGKLTAAADPLGEQDGASHRPAGQRRPGQLSARHVIGCPDIGHDNRIP